MATVETLTVTTSLVGEGPGMPFAESNSGSCPHCGLKQPPTSTDDGAAQRRIQELEEQVRYLNEKAIETAQKLADYEEQIHALRLQVQRQNQTRAESSTTSSSTLPTTPTLSHTSPDRPSSQQQQSQPQTRLATFASYLPYGRRSTNTSTSSSSQLAPTTPPRPATAVTSTDTGNHMASVARTALELSLQDALHREQALRKAAETRLSQTHSELEDLMTQLFSQANEMVAQERKARAKLEERIEILERRDGEKKARLERLEKAVERVERVRTLVGS
ncbi:hypothetical protein VTO42DRAFT_7298 [Malbranchea cinnamomea]